MRALQRGGAYIGKNDGFAGGSKQRPEFKTWSDWGKGREAAGKIVGTNLSHVSQFTFTQMSEFMFSENVSVHGLSLQFRSTSFAIILLKSLTIPL
jgi:hypothetical protein